MGTFEDIEKEIINLNTMHLKKKADIFKVRVLTRLFQSDERILKVGWPQGRFVYDENDFDVYKLIYDENDFDVYKPVFQIQGLKNEKETSLDLYDFGDDWATSAFVPDEMTKDVYGFIEILDHFHEAIEYLYGSIPCHVQIDRLKRATIKPI